MKLRHTTFLKAAQSIDNGREFYSCCAISAVLGTVLGDGTSKEEDFYQELFDVEPSDTFLERFKRLTKKGLNKRLTPYHAKQLQEVRVLCLLFAYHAAKP